MAEYPRIRDYKPFYIQTINDESAIDIAEEYGLIVKSSPLSDLPAMKEPAKNEWHDENGDDEYLAQTFFEAQDYAIDFYVKTTSAESSDVAVQTLLAQKKAFFNLIKSGEFSFYDSYWGFGRQKVRYVSSSEEEKKQGKSGSVFYARQIFKIKFKINDPITDMIMSGGSIVEA